MKKEQIKKVIEQEEFSLVKMELMEKYTLRQMIASGKKKLDLLLGAMQRDIKFKKDYIKFLKDYES